MLNLSLILSGEEVPLCVDKIMRRGGAAYLRIIVHN